MKNIDKFTIFVITAVIIMLLLMSFPIFKTAKVALTKDRESKELLEEILNDYSPKDEQGKNVKVFATEKQQF